MLFQARADCITMLCFECQQVPVNQDLPTAMKIGPCPFQQCCMHPGSLPNSIEWQVVARKVPQPLSPLKTWPFKRWKRLNSRFPTLYSGDFPHRESTAFAFKIERKTSVLAAN
jgi:hypothetical protein